MTLDVTPGMFLWIPHVARVAVLAYRGDDAYGAVLDAVARHLAQMVPQAPWRFGMIVLGEAGLLMTHGANAGRGRRRGS